MFVFVRVCLPALLNVAQQPHCKGDSIGVTNFRWTKSQAYAYSNIISKAYPHTTLYGHVLLLRQKSGIFIFLAR